MQPHKSTPNMKQDIEGHVAIYADGVATRFKLSALLQAQCRGEENGTQEYDEKKKKVGKQHKLNWERPRENIICVK